MKTAMLAAGVGSRLGMGEDAPPKALLRFDGVSLLQRHLEILAHFGLLDLTLVVGHQAGAIEAELGAVGAHGRVRPCFDPDYRKSSLLCAAWGFLGWLSGSVEISLAFWLLGHPIGPVEAVVLESLGQALRSAGFALPGGLGVQEGGIVAGALILGIAPDLALAVALIKRAREPAYGVPGLVAWSLTGLARRGA